MWNLFWWQARTPSTAWASEITRMFCYNQQVPKKQLEHVKPTTVSAKTYETERSAAGHETFLTDALARVRIMPQQKRRKKNKNYTLLTSCLEIFEGTEGGKLSVPCPGGKQINTYSFYVPPPPGTSSFVYWLLGYTFLEDKWYWSKAIQANHHLNKKELGGKTELEL